MNRQAAINLMMRGPQIKITHQYFSPDEYIYMIDGEIYDENDYRMKCNGPNGQIITFWTDRTGPEWEEGWSIYKTDADKLLEANEGIIPNAIDHYADRRRYEKPSSPIFKSKNSHKRTNKKH